MVLSAREYYHNRPVCREKRDGTYRDIFWQDFEQTLHDYAGALLDLGVNAGDRIAIMAPNGPHWVWADLAIQCCGGVSVPIYHTEGLPNTLYILKDSGSRFLFAWSPLVVADLLEHLDEIPELEKVFLLRGEYAHAKVCPLEKFLAAAANANDLVADRLAAGSETDLASIVYTSGTTGPPKGVRLTHGNFLSNVRACSTLFDLGPQDTCLSFLPLSHVFERMAGYYLMLHQGVTIAYAESIDKVPVNMPEACPTIIISVPRLYEKMYARIMEKVTSGSWVKRKLFFGGLALCIRRAQLERDQGAPGWLKAATDLIRRVIFNRLRTPLGGRLRFFVSGGAPLSRKVAEFFLAAGIPIYEGYGLTETSPVIAVNTPTALRLGTVGRALPNTRVKIAADGEILAAGPGIFQGYWNRPEQTAEALEDGWFHTGDVGEIDPDGFLAITDRKKDLIVTAGGENIAPQIIEQLLKSDKFIANTLVYGDRRAFLTALIVPNFDNLGRYARLKGISFLTHCDLVNHPQVLSLLRRRIEALQQESPGFMQIRRFTLLSRDFLAENGELTQTLKIRRRVVAKKFHHVIEGMYMHKDHGIHDHGFCIRDENQTLA